MARVLIVGCGCRGRSLAAALIAEGYAVRGTTRDRERLPAITAVGAEGGIADPDRLATVTPLLEGVSELCWLMGSATGAPEQVEALHGPRLRSLLETLIDTHVRGVVYEAAGGAEGSLRARGVDTVREIGQTHHMPVSVVDVTPGELDVWLAAMTGAVGEVLRP